MSNSAKIANGLTKVMGIFLRCLIAYPARDAACLLIIFFILGTQFQSGTIGKFEFEYSEYILYAGCLYYFVIPSLLYANSFRFKSSRISLFSGLISIVLVLIMFLAFLYNLFLMIFEPSPNIVRRAETPNGQIVTLYEKRLDSLNSCRYLIRQQRIVPGILRNDMKLIKETCRFDGHGNPFPPNLS